MPIRLTRQILKLMAPLEHSGYTISSLSKNLNKLNFFLKIVVNFKSLFEASMVHILRALRENNDLLMCILDVFVKEPSMDWIVRKKKRKEEVFKYM